MRINNKTMSVVFKIIIFLSALIGIIFQSGILEGNFKPYIFNYYTLLSNIICMIYFGFAAIYCYKKNKTLLPMLKGALIIIITVTGIVYHFLLSDIVFNMSTDFRMGSILKISNILLHYIVPIGALLDWLLFDEKGHYTYKLPII